MEINIAAIAKREEMTIADWVEYHRNIGVSHIHIFDNYDVGDDTLLSVLKPYIDMGFVTVHDDYKGVVGAQVVCYRHILELNKNGKLGDWVGIIDCDEYFSMRKSYGTVDKFFEDVENNCPNIGSLYVNWECYTSNHKLFYEPDPVTERFPEKFPLDFEPNVHVKSFVRKGCHSRLNTTHDMVPLDGRLIYDTLCRQIKPSPFQEVRDDYPVYLNHYLVKSLQEYMYQKYLRNTVTNEGCGKYTWDYFLNNCGDPEYYKQYFDIFSKLMNDNA